MNDQQATSPPMVVYDGTLAMGEIKNYGRHNIRAYVYTDGEPILIGTYPDRRAALGAVSEAAANQQVKDRDAARSCAAEGGR